MSLFIKKNNKWYRNNSDGTLSEVLLGLDGYFYWTQSDGKKVRSAKKYKIVKKSKSKEKSIGLKVIDFLTNASIQASVAENPSVMTAAGYERNKDSSWKVDPTSKGATLLRDNLKVVGSTGLMALIPGVLPATLIGAGTETAERAVTGKSIGDITSNFVKEHNPFSDNSIGSYFWDKGSDLVRPEYGLYSFYKWGTTPKLVGSGAEFDVYSAPFWRNVKKVGEVTPKEIALKNEIPGTIPMKYKGTDSNGLHIYTLKKAIIPKEMPSLDIQTKLYNKLMKGMKFKPKYYDQQTGMFDFVSKDGNTVVTDLGQGNIGYRNLFDYVFKRLPIIIDNAVLSTPEYLSLFEKNGGKLIPKKFKNGGIFKFEQGGNTLYTDDIILPKDNWEGWDFLNENSFKSDWNINKLNSNDMNNTNNKLNWSVAQQNTDRYNSKNDTYLNEIFRIGTEFGFNNMQLAAIIANAIHENQGSPLTTPKNGRVGLWQGEKTQAKYMGNTIESNMKAFIEDYKYGKWYNTTDKNGWNPNFHKLFKNGTTIEDVVLGMTGGYERFKGGNDRNNSEVKSRTKTAKLLYNMLENYGTSNK